MKEKGSLFQTKCDITGTLSVVWVASARVASFVPCHAWSKEAKGITGLDMDLTKENFTEFQRLCAAYFERRFSVHHCSLAPH